MRLIFYSLIFLIGIAFISCKNEPNRLPYLGNLDIRNGDTIFHTIPDIRLMDQDSQALHIRDLEDKIIIADFFFTSCPSICPKVKKQMLRLYDRYKTEDRIVMISHTIDTRNDSVSVLHRYANNLGVDTDKWRFVTGEKDSIFFLADQYFVSVEDDPTAPGGFDHSGRIILVDQEKHVRGFCEGTDPESVTAFFDSVDQLLAEKR